MKKEEQPQEGGSYVRQKDGSLKRTEQTKPAPAPPPEAPARDEDRT